jgi:hypothetical protein
MKFAAGTADNHIAQRRPLAVRRRRVNADGWSGKPEGQVHAAGGKDVFTSWVGVNARSFHPELLHVGCNARQGIRVTSIQAM